MNPDSFDTSDQSATVSNQSPSPQAPTQATTPDPSQAPSQPVSPATQPSNQPTTQNQQTAPTTLPPSNPTSPSPANAPTPAVASTSGTVSNAQPNQNHPAVQRASILHSIGEALAGGPRYTTTIDPVTGDTTRTPVPLSRGQIGMAIALEAISGSLSGLAERGPGATGRAALAGFNQQAQAQAQRQQAQEQQAQQDAKNKSDALMAQAQAFEQNSRTILNTAQAQRMGVESLKDSVAANEKLLSDYSDEGAVQDQNVSEDELKAGMANGKYDSTKQIAIPDGFTNINGHYEQTFSVVSNPSAKVPLSNDQVQEFAAAGIPGFLPYRDGTKIVDDFRVPGTIVARANAQLQALNLMKQDAQTVQDTLAQSNDKDNQALAASIPDLQTLLDDPKRGAGLFGALQRFQKYVSHSDQHGMDFAESLAQMASPSKPDPNNPKQVVPNQDAPFAQTIYGAFGNGDPVKGRAILTAYHNEITPEPIKSEAEAASIIANNPPTSKAYKIAQRWIASNTAQKAAVARAGRELANGPNIPGNPSLISPTPANGVNTGYLQSLPPAQQRIVQAIGEGRQEGPNTRTKEGQALSEMVNNAYPGYDGTRFPTYQAMQKDFVSGKSSQGLQALNTALSHLQTAYDNANLGSTLPGISNLERLGGNQSAVALKAASTAVSDELGRAYKAGVVSETERQQWQALLNGWTPANVKQNAVAFAHLLDGKLSSYEQTLRNGAPSAAVRLPALMSPQAASAYTHMTGEAPATSVGTNQASGAPSQPTPAQQFIKITSDGKLGWNGQQWVTIPNGGRQ